MEKSFMFRIDPPTTPNFLRRVDPAKPLEWVQIPIQDLTDEELRQIGKEFTENMIRKARKTP